MPTVSIIICTWNNAASLRATMEAIGRVAVPADLPAELVVVDNASTDDTPQVVESTRLTNMPVRRLLERERGKCRALNRALAETKSDIIVFTDEDVHPPADWIEGICRPIAQGRADAVQGGIAFPAEYEPFMSQPAYRTHRTWFASSEGLDPNHLDQMIGANMAVGRHVFSRVPGFDVNLGPYGLGFGEDTLFALQILDEGFRLIPAFHVAAEHYFDRSRLSRKHMLVIAERMGRTAAYIGWHWKHRTYPVTPYKLLRRHALLWKRRLLHPLDWIGTDIPADWELEVAESIGFQRQYLIESRLPRRYQRRTQPVTMAMAS